MFYKNNFLSISLIIYLSILNGSLSFCSEFDREQLIEQRDIQLYKAINSYQNQDYKQALALAYQARNAAISNGLWDLSPSDQDAISFIIADSSLKTGTPDKGRYDLRNVCNKPIDEQLSVITSHEIEHLLQQTILQRSLKKPHLLYKLCDELLHYEQINSDISYALLQQEIVECHAELSQYDGSAIVDMFKKKTLLAQQIVLYCLTYEHARNGNLKALAVLTLAYKKGTHSVLPSSAYAIEFAQLYVQSLAKNFDNVPFEHFAMKAVLDDLVNCITTNSNSLECARLYYNYLQALRNNSEEQIQRTANALQSREDEQSPLRNIFLNMLNTKTASRLQLLKFEEKESNLERSFHLLLRTDKMYLIPLLEKELLLNPSKAEVLHYALGLLYFFDNCYQEAYTHFTQTKNYAHDIPTLHKTFESFNQFQMPLTLENCLKGSEMITNALLQEKKVNKRNKSALPLLSDSIARYAPMYMELLYKADKIQAALQLAYACTTKEETYTISLNGIDFIFNKLCDAYTKEDKPGHYYAKLIDSQAFKAISQHAIEKKDTASLDLICWINTTLILMKLDSQLSITDKECEQIQYSLRAFQHSSEERKCLEDLCSTYYYKNYVAKTNFHEKIAHLDKAIEFNNEQAIEEKLKFLVQSTETTKEDMLSLIGQLTVIARHPGRLQGKALHHLTFLSFPNKLVKIGLMNENLQLSYKYAQQCYSLGNKEVTEYLGYFYCYGIRHDNSDEWFLKPDYKKARSFLKEYLATQPYYPQVDYNLAVAYYREGKKYNNKALAILENIVLDESASDFALIKSQSLIYQGLIRLYSVDNIESIEQALDYFEQAATSLPFALYDSAIHEDLFVHLMNYTNILINDNTQDNRAIALCSFVGQVLIVSEDLVRKKHGRKCLEYAANNNNLDAQLLFFDHSYTEEYRWQNVFYLEKALKTVSNRNDDSHTALPIQTSLLLLYPKTFDEKYQFIRYLFSKNENVTLYLGSDPFCIIKFITKEFLNNHDEANAQLCIEDGFLGEYVQEMQEQKAQASVAALHGALLYAYMLGTSDKVEYLQKSASLLALICTIPKYQRTLTIQQLLGALYYKLGNHFCQANSPVLALAYFKKSADLGIVPCVLFLADQWLKNSTLTTSLTAQEILAWLNATKKNTNLITTEDDDKNICSAISLCTKKIAAHKKNTQSATCVLQALQRSGDVLFKRLCANATSPEQCNPAFQKALMHQNSTVQQQMFDNLVKKTNSSHAALCLFAIHCESDLEKAKKYFALVMQHGLKRSNQNADNMLFKDKFLLDTLADALIAIEEAGLISVRKALFVFMKDQLSTNNVDLKAFEEYLYNEKGCNLAKDPHWNA